MDYSIDEVKGYVDKITTTVRHWQFGSKAQLAFLEDLYLLISDGIPANRAVEMMSQVTQGMTREVSEYLAQKIAQGQPLADGMKEWFAMNVVEIIRVGETGGALPQAMQSAIKALSQRGVAMSAFLGAITYPLFVIVIAAIVIVYLKTSIFTQFEMIKPMSMWPESGRRLVAIATLISNWWWILILAVTAIILIFRRLLVYYTGEFRPLLDKVPPFSFYRKLIAARLLETLGLLVSNGVVFKSAIKVMQYQANPYMLSHLVKMERLLGMGKTNIADVLNTGLVEDQDLMRLRIMAEVKGFEHGLIRMGVRGSEQATTTLKFISRIIGGTFLVMGGILIILIVQGIYLTGMSLGT